MAATAARFLIGVRPLEALVHKFLLKLKHRTVQVNEALRIDHEAHLLACAGDHVVHAVARMRRAVVKFDHIAEARAATPANAHAQARAVDRALFDLRVSGINGALRKAHVGQFRRCAAGLNLRGAHQWPAAFLAACLAR